MKTQLDYIAALTPNARLNQAFYLSDLVREIARKNIQDQNPKVSENEIQILLKKRIYGTLRTERHSSPYSV